MNSSEGFHLASLPHEAKIQVLVNASDSEYRILCLLDPMKSLCNDEQTVSRIFQDKCQNRYSTDILEIKQRDMSWKDFYYHFGPFYQIFKMALNTGTGVTFSDIERAYGTLIPQKDKLKADDNEILQDYTANPNLANLFAFYGLTNEFRFLESPELLELSEIQPDERGANYAAGKGHLDTLEYLYEKYEIVPDSFGLFWASQNNHVNVLRWFDEISNEFDGDDIVVAINYASQHSAYNALRYFIQKGYYLEGDDLINLIINDMSSNFSISAEFIKSVDYELGIFYIVDILKNYANRTEEILNLFYNNGYRFDWSKYYPHLREWQPERINRIRNWFLTKGLPVE